MKLLFILIAHLLVALAKLARAGGLAALVAESLAVKHQLLIMKRAQRRAPNLTPMGSAGAGSDCFVSSRSDEMLRLASRRI
jgi:hypothetical protein